MLSGVCAALPGILGVSGAVIVLAEPADPVSGAVFGSDDAAGRLGMLQYRAGSGPALGAVRSGRVMITPDLTRIGPPELAAAAADTGLIVSLAVPLVLDGEAIGGLQLLGRPGVWMDLSLADQLAPLVDALSARLADVRELGRLMALLARATAERERAAAVEQATGMLAERYGTDVEEAVRYLHSRARNTGHPLADTAAAVLARTDGAPAVTVPDPRAGGPGERVDPVPGAGGEAHHDADADLRSREERFREARSRAARSRAAEPRRTRQGPGPGGRSGEHPVPGAHPPDRAVPGRGEVSPVAETQAIAFRPEHWSEAERGRPASQPHEGPAPVPPPRPRARHRRHDA